MSIDEESGTFKSFADGREVINARVGKDSSSVKDKLGTVTLRSEIRDGKKYMVLDLGNRRILIEGDKMIFKTGANGEIIIQKPAP